MLHPACFPPLNWVDRLHIFLFLTLKDIRQYGLTCKTAYVLFERELAVRKDSKKPFDIRRLLGHGILEGIYDRNIVLVSYPRSGNSLLRQLLEQYTDIYTGRIILYLRVYIFTYMYRK